MADLTYVVRSQIKAQAAAKSASLARMQLARDLADAQANGASVRTLADLLDVQPTTVQRLIAASKGSTS